MARVTTVRPLEDYCLDVAFDDGTQGVISLADRLFGPIFAPLRDNKFFSEVFVDEFGAICWPNGADQAPDAVHQRLQHSSTVT